MDSNFTNIDEAFKNAFEHAEASFSKAEMHADWSKVANQIPAGPVPHTPAPHHILNHFTGGLGKVLGLSGLGAATVTAIVILYNVYTNNNSPVPAQNKQLADKTAPQVQTRPQTQNHVSHSQSPLASQPLTGTSEKSTGNKNGMGPAAGRPFSNQASPFSGSPALPLPNPLQVQPNGGGNTISPGHNNPVRKPDLHIILSTSLICVNQAVSVSTGAIGALNIEWGDGYLEPLNGTLSHAFLRAGRYGIHVSGPGISMDTLITVVEKPKAGFSAHQVDKLTYNFSNLSVQGTKYAWIFDDGSADDNSYYAAHTFPDTGRHLVRLVAYNAGGCTDTFSQYLSVNEFLEPVVSANVITPNGDNKDDDFYVNIQNEANFRLTVVDHTGMIVFDTNDKNKHWTGKNQFTGSDCMPGAYFYSISYSFKQNSEPRTKNGSVTLFR